MKYAEEIPETEKNKKKKRKKKKKGKGGSKAGAIHEASEDEKELEESVMLDVEIQSQLLGVIKADVNQLRSQIDVEVATLDGKMAQGDTNLETAQGKAQLDAKNAQQKRLQLMRDADEITALQGLIQLYRLETAQNQVEIDRLKEMELDKKRREKQAKKDKKARRAANREEDPERLIEERKAAEHKALQLEVEAREAAEAKKRDELGLEMEAKDKLDAEKLRIKAENLRIKAEERLIVERKKAAEDEKREELRLETEAKDKLDSEKVKEEERLIAEHKAAKRKVSDEIKKEKKREKLKLKMKAKLKLKSDNLKIKEEAEAEKRARKDAETARLKAERIQMDPENARLDSEKTRLDSEKALLNSKPPDSGEGQESALAKENSPTKHSDSVCIPETTMDTQFLC